VHVTYTVDFQYWQSECSQNYEFYQQHLKQHLANYLYKYAFVQKQNIVKNRMRNNILVLSQNIFYIITNIILIIFVQLQCAFLFTLRDIYISLVELYYTYIRIYIIKMY